MVVRLFRSICCKLVWALEAQSAVRVGTVAKPPPFLDDNAGFCHAQEKFLVDHFDRSCPTLYAGHSIGAGSVVEALERATVRSGLPKAISVDNGPEFAGQVLDAWAYQRGVHLDFIRPGRPTENGYIESFNGRLRDELMNTEIFFNLDEVREKLERWRQDYNTQRPHSALGYRPPLEYRKQTVFNQQADPTTRQNLTLATA